MDYALIEWVSKKNVPVELQPPQKYVLPLLQPADGSLVDALEALLISVEQAGWSGASRTLILPVGERAASRISGEDGGNLISLLRNTIARRNDGAEGHGLPGGYDREADIDALRFLIDGFRNFLPQTGKNDSLQFGPTGSRTELQFLRTFEGSPCLIRRVKTLARDRCRVYCQRVSGNLQREEFNYDSTNPFFTLGGQGAPQLTTWDNSWNPLCFVPDRTTDTFTGRQSQIEELVEWANDEGSRASLIFGDGGYGKTTLAIEFAHQLLDEQIQVEWRPSVIVFYTAKRTQWGLDGLRPVGVGQPHLVEMLAQVHQLLFSAYPDQNFYRSTAVEATSKLQTRIKNDLGYTPKDVLLIVDNTETLISSEEERTELGKELREVGRRVGRTLLTSRRRELTEAVPIAIDVLDESEALDLIKRRGRKLNSKLLNKASDSELLKEISALERRPIVLEALANAASDPSVRKLQDATTRVASMLQRELGEFLFADAWGRFALDVRRVLLLMARVGDAHDAQSLKICSDVISISPSATEQALEESGGIASTVVIQGQPQITFSRNFLEFAKNKSVKLASGMDSPSDAEVSKAREAYSAFVRDAQKFTGDRVGEAYRIPQARAAHQARQQGKFEEARRLYEAAVLNDSTNGWLRDRFAYFLFHDLRDNEAALHQAKKAVELLPDEGEVWFTRGLIEARLGNPRASEISLRKAHQLGIPEIRCDVQRAWAYLKSRPVQLPIAKALIAKLERGLSSHRSDPRLKNELQLLKGRYDHLYGKYGIGG
ncbi:ATP-binding protein [Pseudoxanthomonas sangjuensis]|uniref:ATP-binding protein n=1 Tax=Pseudoxanthomonas sangjuensis TaxID=1503750 RepID=UPI00139166C7|nr:ATP-binding protein [Pseudoxanthomonas sangjuensis]